MALLCAALTAGCEDQETAFIGSRVTEQCNESWPVCDLVAGCIMGNESYFSGRFPGTQRMIVRLAEASHVTASFYLKSVAGSGTSTVITFYEGGCQDRTRVEITGDAFVQENQSVGFVARSQDLTDVGDHRLEFTSDVQAEYDFKLDVEPLRLEGTDTGP